MNGLKSQFHPKEVSSVYLIQKFQHILSQTVRTCTYNQTFDPGILKDRKILFPEFFNGRIGIGMILEICQISGVRPFVGKKGDLAVYVGTEFP